MFQEQYLSCENSWQVLGLLNKIVLTKFIHNRISIYSILWHATPDTFQNLIVWWRNWNVCVETSQEQQANPKACIFCISWGLKEKLAFQNWSDKSPCGQENTVWTTRVQQLLFASLYSRLSSSKLKGSAEILPVAHLAVGSVPAWPWSRSSHNSGVCRNFGLFLLKPLLHPHLFFSSGKDSGLSFFPCFLFLFKCRESLWNWL